VNDDILGEIYKCCPDSLTKRNLRQACRMTYTSPAINCQLSTVRAPSRPSDALAAVRSFPRHATLHRLDLRKLDRVAWLRAAVYLQVCADEQCRHKLSGLKELRGLVSPCAQYPASVLLAVVKKGKNKLSQ
jgi:hypothetical protein